MVLAGGVQSLPVVANLGDEGINENVQHPRSQDGAASQQAIAPPGKLLSKILHMLDELTDRFYHASAARPATVACVVIASAIVLTLLPFGLFLSDAVLIDLTLDKIAVRGVDVANRARSLGSAWDHSMAFRNSQSSLQVEDLNTTAGVAASVGSNETTTTVETGRSVSTTSLTAVYMAKDGGNVLTEDRLLQALHLEQQVSSRLGAPTQTPLGSFFPRYPQATGGLQGAALMAAILQAAEDFKGTEDDSETGAWPNYERNFSACRAESAVLSSTFAEPLSWSRKVEVYSTDLDLETEDLYLVHFQSESNAFFREELSSQIEQDIFLLVGVVLGVLPVLILMTNSLFVPCLGLVSIGLAAGVAWFAYRILISNWFGLLNGFSCFLLLGIGCDDIFVISDTWRQSFEVDGFSPDDYLGRLRYTVPRSGKAITITSFTAAVAFFGSAVISIIPPIKLFGIFSGFVVIFDLAMTILLLPSVLVLQHRLFGHQKEWPCLSCLPARRTCKRPECSMDVLLQRFAPLVVRAAPAVTILAAALAGLSLNVAVDMPGAAQYHPSDLFSDSHNQVRAFKSQQLLERPNPIFRSVWIVFGVQAVETGDILDPSSRTTPVWDTAFDIYDVAVQQYALDFCRDLLARQTMVRKLERCWAQELQSYMTQRGWQFPSSTRWQVDAAILYEFNTGFPSVLRTSTGHHFATIRVLATLEDKASVSEMRHHFDMWENTVKEWNGKAPGAVKSFHVADHWVGMRTIESLPETTFLALAVSAGLSTLVLVLMFRNCVLAGLTILHICGMCAVMIAMWQVAGRSLAPVESLALALLIGLAVDYPTHVAAAYAAHPASEPRTHRVMAAVRHLGRAVVGGAATTITSGIFLCVSKVTYFQAFGLFTIQIISLSVLTTLIPFLASLSLWGPEQSQCRVCCTAVPTLSGQSSEEVDATKDEDVGLRLRPQPGTGRWARTREGDVFDMKAVTAHSAKVRAASGLVVAVILLTAIAVCLGREFSPEEVLAPSCPDIQELDISIEDFQIPAETDTYRCKGFNAINPACTYYVSEITPLIEPAERVNNMLLYSTVAAASDCPFDCQNMPTADGIIAAWTVGKDPIVWPDGVAFSMRGGSQALQVHYENENRSSDLVASRSGLRMKLSTTAPRHVLGSIGVGLHPRGILRIPPGLPSATFFVECAPVLLGEITVLAYATHAHKAGRAVITQLFRGSSQTAPIGDVGSTPNYDVNGQHVEIFPSGQERRLVPGDTIRVLCTYNTTDRLRDTTGGFASNQEMCMIYLYAYPAHNIGQASCNQQVALPMP